MQSLSIDHFISANGTIIDVRSPGEYEKGHIPGAINIPLFNNEERAAIGKTYVKVGRIEAVELGLKYVEPKLSHFVDTAKRYSPDRTVKLYCWRGGMRSSSLAWLLEIAGFHCSILQRGYKSFRNWVLDSFKTPINMIVLGGFTGSGKTDILHIIESMGYKILDLEALANHFGSSYGKVWATT